MFNFAVIENELVINTIVADSKETAEQITGKTCVKFTTEPAETGGTYVDGKFRRIKQYPSWIYDGKNGWIPPVEYPLEEEKNFIWNEETISWIEVVSEE